MCRNSAIPALGTQSAAGTDACNINPDVPLQSPGTKQYVFQNQGVLPHRYLKYKHQPAGLYPPADPCFLQILSNALPDSSVFFRFFSVYEKNSHRFKPMRVPVFIDYFTSLIEKEILPILSLPRHTTLTTSPRVSTSSTCSILSLEILEM